MSSTATTQVAPRGLSFPIWRPFQGRLEVKPNPYLGTLGVFLGAGITTLFGRLLSVGLPDLRGALGLGVDEASWIPTTYSMGLMFMGPFSVYLGGLLGVRRVLLFCAPIYAVVSFLAPFSPNLAVLLALQVIAGLLSGTFYPLTMTFALRQLPLRFTIYGIGVYSMDILAGTSLAVPLQAFFNEHLSWRWIFWIGPLASMLMILCIYRAIPNPPARTGPKPHISWAGFLWASVALSLLYGVLDQGERLDWLGSGVIVAMLVSAAFLILAAIIRRWISPNPLVNIPFLGQRNILILYTGLFGLRFVILAIALLVPGYLGAIQGYRPLETGRVLLWVAAPQVVIGLVAAWLMRRLDQRLMLATGFATVAVACLLNAQLTSAWAGDNFWTSQLVIAVGLSFTFVSLIGGMVQYLQEVGALSRPFNVLTFSCFVHSVRILGGEAGSSLMGHFIAVREKFHSNLIGLHVEVGDWLTDERLRWLTGGVSSNSSGLDEAQKRSVALLSGQVRQQAFTLAYMDAFMFMAWVALGLIVLIAFMKRTKILFDSQSTKPPGA